MTCNTTQELRKVKTRPLSRLVQELRENHAQSHSWRKASMVSKVLTVDGRPDPGLAQRIAEQGYDPKRDDTRARLGLPPTCIVCGRKVKRVRHIPPWLEEAVENLRQLEIKAHDRT
jgi:hypothetical protein